MQASKFTGAYRSCDVVVLHWGTETTVNQKLNQGHLASVLCDGYTTRGRGYNYKFHHKDLSDYSPVNGGEQSGLFEWFEDWLEGHEQCVKLLIVCYVGHAGVWEQNLMIADNDGFSVNFTKFQGIARDACDSDVLFLLEACRAGFEGLSLRTTPKSADADQHTVMTFAACGEEEICTIGSSQDFTRLIGSALLYERMPQKQWKVWDWTKTVEQARPNAKVIVHCGDPSARIPLMPAFGSQLDRLVCPERK